MKIAVRADSLPYLLNEAPQDIEYLSLDCFDTLLWRNVQVPGDVFADLPIAGGALEPRMWAERFARHVALRTEGRQDVTLDEIHSYLTPAEAPEERETLIQAELDAEAAHCFGFAPVRDLMLQAKARGLKIIIVSDTYLSEERLRTLIARAAGEDVIAMVDHVFVSCHYGHGKSSGLFLDVLKALGTTPDKLLHVGDNGVADQQVPSSLGINTVRLVQFDEVTDQRLRLEAAVGTMMEPGTRVDFPLLQCHRAQVAMRKHDDPVYTFGHDVLGPIMYGFASWLRGEAEAMEAETGKKVKLLFLLRDGHLPFKAFTTLYPEWEDRCAQVELSRFTATAASFTGRKAIADYLKPVLQKTPGGGTPLFAKQLLFDEKDWDRLSSMPGSFYDRMLKPSNVKKIVERSAKFSQRLFKHLRAQGVEKGDAVILVDLGYAGSVQNVIEPVLRKQLGLDVAGRYLLLREMWRTKRDKKGLLDTRNYDFKALYSISEDISILEQFATLDQGSVVDYAADGAPVRNPHTVNAQQSSTRAHAQDACLRFLRAVDEPMVRAPASDDIDSRRRTAMSVLARLLFLPLDSEVAMLRDFEHDVNMGTGVMMPMMDLEAAATGMRRRGMFYIKDASRIYLPGELQRHGLPANLSSFSARRYSLDLRKADFDVGGIQVPIIAFDGQGGSEMRSVEAYPTAEGFYQALIPVGAGRYTIGLRFGAQYEYVQLEEVAFQLVGTFLSDSVKEQVLPAVPITDKMEEVAPNFYRIPAREGFMLVPPPANVGDTQLLLSVVFRPVLARNADVLSYQQAA